MLLPYSPPASPVFALAFGNKLECYCRQSVAIFFQIRGWARLLLNPAYSLTMYLRIKGTLEYTMDIPTNFTEYLIWLLDIGFDIN
jgi:hypothetical protein